MISLFASLTEGIPVKKLPLFNWFSNHLRALVAPLNSWQIEIEENFPLFVFRKKVWASTNRVES